MKNLLKLTTSLVFASSSLVVASGFFGTGGSGGGGGSGTVTSVGLALPSFITVSGSPVSTTGTLTGTLATQNANLVFAGPSSGAAAAPTFRLLAATDIPSLSYVSSVSVNSPLTSIGSLTPTLSITKSDTSHDGYLSAADWTTFNGKQAALTIGNLTETGSANLVVTGGTGSVIGSGVSLALTGSSIVEATSSVLTLTGATNAVLGTGVSIQVKQSSGSVSGYLSSTDWTTFNSKQAAGSYITALTGDVAAAGPGSSAATLATVNSNVGSFSAANITVNAKGLITAASNGVAVVVNYAPTMQRFTASGAFTYNLDHLIICSSANATVGATYTNNSVTFTVMGTIAAGTLLWVSGNGDPSTSGTLTKASGTGDATITFSSFKDPVYLELEVVGGGGGGGGQGGNGSTGGNSTLGASGTLITANGGAAGTSGPVVSGGQGGTVSHGTSVLGDDIQGGSGGPGSNTPSIGGGIGGNTCRGGGGTGGGSTAAGAAGGTNTGGGGGGNGAPAAGGSNSGGGGGGCFRGIYGAPGFPAIAQTYSGSVGASGAAGTGTPVGGAGAIGDIKIWAHYQ